MYEHHSIDSFERTQEFLYEEDDLLMLSGIEHILYCERQTALIHIEGLWIENALTALGRDRHAKAHEPSVENRGDLRIVRGLRMRSLELGLIGMADVTEFHMVGDDGMEAVRNTSLPGQSGKWRPYPIEYKKGAIRKEPGYEVQVCAQAICLEEMLDVDVPEGAIFFGESSHRWQVVFDLRLRKRTREAAKRFHELVATGETPRASVSRKCPNCSLVDACLPKTSRIGSVSKYLQRSLERALTDEEAT